MRILNSVNQIYFLLHLRAEDWREWRENSTLKIRQNFIFCLIKIITIWKLKLWNWSNNIFGAFLKIELAFNRSGLKNPIMFFMKTQKTNNSKWNITEHFFSERVQHNYVPPFGMFVQNVLFCEGRNESALFTRFIRDCFYLFYYPPRHRIRLLLDGVRQLSN